MDLIDRNHFHKRFLKTWEWCEKQGLNTEAFSYVEELINTELSAQPYSEKTYVICDNRSAKREETQNK